MGWEWWNEVICGGYGDGYGELWWSANGMGCLSCVIVVKKKKQKQHKVSYSKHESSKMIYMHNFNNIICARIIENSYSIEAISSGQTILISFVMKDST